VEFTNCTSLVTNNGPKGDQRSWRYRCRKPVLVKMSDTGTKISVPQQRGIILFKTLDILGEYSLRYSLSTRVVNYSDSTALYRISQTCVKSRDHWYICYYPATYPCMHHLTNPICQSPVWSSDLRQFSFRVRQSRHHIAQPVSTSTWINAQPTSPWPRAPWF